MSQFKIEILKLAETTLLTNTEIGRIVGCSPRTVHKHAGSYTDRRREKSGIDAKSFEVQKTVLMPDIHYPYQDKKSMNAMEEFIIDYDPDELVYTGDQFQLDSISSWNVKKPLLKEHQRLIKDYKNFNRDILEIHENITHENTRRIFMMGNHEKRIDWHIQKNPELEGLIDIDTHLHLKERGYTIIDYNHIYKIAKLNVIHGFYWNKYHAAKTSEVFEGNVVYGHVHNPQMYCKVSPIDRKGYHTATSLPCLCSIKPEYKENAPNFWVNGFGIVEHMPATGYYNLYTIIIIEGKFMWNGICYG